MTTVYTDEQLVRLTRRIDEYRAAKRRQRLERDRKLWRRAHGDRSIARWFESPLRRN